MFQHVVKWAFLAAFFRKVKPYLLTSLVFSLLLIFVFTAHAEFLDYLQIRSTLGAGADSDVSLQPWLVASFLAKWGAILVLGLLWLLRLRRISASLQASKPDRSSRTPRAASAGLDAERGNSALAQTSESPEDDAAFDFLRNKRRLRSRAEIVLDEHRDKP